MKLFVVTAPLGVQHLVSAKSSGHAVQVVTKTFSVSPAGLEARVLCSDPEVPQVIRSDYPNED